jgi:pyruvate-formate lyase
VIGGVVSATDTRIKANVLSVQIIKAINHPQTGKDTQGNSTKSTTNTNFATKLPAKSKEPTANKKISQLKLADETSQTDNSQTDDETSQTDNYSQVNKDSEDIEALAGLVAASDNSISKAEKVPEIMEKCKPNKKQPTQTVRDRIQASHKEPSIKGFQRKVSN